MVGRRYGGPAATGYTMEFRTRLAQPGGRVTKAQFEAVTRYRDQAQCRQAIEEQAAAGLLDVGPDGDFAGTDRARAFLSEIYALQARFTGELWSEHEDRIARLAQTLGLVLAAATDTGGDALRAMAPPYEPDGTGAGVLVLNRLGTLRYHRADAHAAAWGAAGLTAAEMVALPVGARRDAIEADTNVRGAPPFVVLTPAQRLELLADLAALPA